jgi:hypothetical protein
MGTGNGLLIYIEDRFVGDGYQGKVVIYSNQSAVYCSAMVGSSSSNTPGSLLHMVRFNPNAGVVE